MASAGLCLLPTVPTSVSVVSFDLQHIQHWLLEQVLRSNPILPRHKLCDFGQLVHLAFLSPFS